MKKSVIILLSVLCTIQVMAQKTAIVPQQFIYTPKKISTFDTERLKRIDSKLNEMVDKGVLPHAVVFVAHKGEVVYNKHLAGAMSKIKYPVLPAIISEWHRRARLLPLQLYSLYSKKVNSCWTNP